MTGQRTSTSDSEMDKWKWIIIKKYTQLIQVTEIPIKLAKYYL